MNIGFIGLGDQGGPMAEMMLRAELPVTVWARRAEVRETFAAKGAKTAESPAALAADCDLLGLCVTGDADVRQLVYDQGLLEAMRPGSILAIHSTVRPALCEEVCGDGAGRGVVVLDAPVSGSGRAALARTLLVMVGGDEAATERARPAWEAFGNPIIHIGGIGAGMKVKLLNNLMASAHKGAGIRAVRGAIANGVQPDMARRVILSGTGRSFGLEVIGRLQDPDRARHIRNLVIKDIALAREVLTGDELKPMFELADEALAWMQKWSDGQDRILAGD